MIYEYRCRECHIEFEVQKPLAQMERGEDCPGCRSLFTERKMSLTAPPQFRGSGFYQTDYKRTPKRGDE